MPPQQVPTFDVFSGESDRDAVWLCAVQGLAEAKATMDAIAAKKPGKYFLFFALTHEILARVETFPNRDARIEPDPNKPVQEDECIAVALFAFNNRTGIATLHVREKRAGAGFYQVLVRFDSGHEIIRSFDSADRYRSAFLVAHTPHAGDSVVRVEIRRLESAARVRA
jgi:hypothetical protein